MFTVGVRTPYDCLLSEVEHHMRVHVLSGVEHYMSVHMSGVEHYMKFYRDILSQEGLVSNVLSEKITISVPGLFKASQDYILMG